MVKMLFLVKVAFRIAVAGVAAGPVSVSFDEQGIFRGLPMV